MHWIFPEVEGRITPLPPGTITLGRDAENDVVLTGEQTSRRHAQIERRGAALGVRDFGSRNGVFVNGIRLPESPLCVGDLLRVGGWLGVVRMVASPQAPTLGFREIRPGYFAGPVFWPILAPVERVAPTDLPVVIQGETGTGKEGVAKALHAWSRRPGALVALNCGAVPEHLAEAELFGYRKGAFTGADRASPGHLRAADHGTLFLDEESRICLWGYRSSCCGHLSSARCSPWASRGRCRWTCASWPLRSHPFASRWTRAACGLISTRVWMA